MRWPWQRRPEHVSSWIPHRECDLKDRAEHVCVAVDKNGQKYTEHVAGTDKSPWAGAFILSPASPQRLREQGLLPLTEITGYEQSDG